ncbi:MAG: two-component system sensor histidine kinase NtrB [Terriglobales bacterium]
MQEATNKLAAIVESSDDAIVSKDLNGIITTWNAGAERTFGWKADEIIGLPITTIIPPELHGDEDMILARIRAGERVDHFETVRLTKTGERIHVSITISPLRDAHGNIVGAAKIARDITDRKTAEDALRRAEKLAVTGRMAATIAHEINNPLEAVTNLLYLLRSHVQGEEGRSCLAMAESELDRVAQITKQTLAFYRSSTSPETVNLTDLLDSVLSMLSRKIARKRITVVRNEQPCTVTAMKGELRQLFTNIVDNALEAAPGGGAVHITVALEGSRTVISVSDNGPGIAPDLQKKIFDPFYTTKQLGTGLGLWVAQEIAEKHGGKITVESSTQGANRGSTFRVALATSCAAEANVTTAA